MAFEVEVEQIIDNKSGALDLSRLFRVSEAQRTTIERGLQPASAMRIKPLAEILMPERQAHEHAKRPRPLPTLTKLHTVPPLLSFLFAQPRDKRHTKLRPHRRMIVGLATGEGSRASGQFNIRDAGTKRIQVPFFLDRFVTAAALKSFAGRSRDTLLRKNGRQWEIVSDSDMIDMADRSVVFRLGKIQLYS